MSKDISAGEVRKILAERYPALTAHMGTLTDSQLMAMWEYTSELADSIIAIEGRIEVLQQRLVEMDEILSHGLPTKH